MRRASRLICVLLCLAAMVLLPVIPAAADDGYTYTVRFYAGSQGTFGGVDVIEYTGLNYGDRVTFNLRDVTLSNESKYYVKGIRESGRDNNTVRYNSFPVTQDMDYVVAYGILGNSVAYTIRYLDEAGNELSPSETYYGNIGDKPVVAYLLIDGYRPHYYNITGTLKENAADNVFTFVYAQIVEPTPTPGPTAAPTAAPGPGGTTPAPGATATPAPTEAPSEEASEETPGPSDEATPAPEETEAPVPETTPQDVLDIDEPVVPAETPYRIEINDPQELFDLDENLIPFAGYYNDDGEWVYYSDEMPELLEKQGSNTGWIIGGVCVAAALALLLFLLLRRRKREEEERGEQTAEAADPTEQIAEPAENNDESSRDEADV